MLWILQSVFVALFLSGTEAAEWSSGTASVNCTEVPPAVIPLFDKNVGNGTVRRGVPVDIGEPPQSVLLDLIPTWNYTHVISPSPDCEKGTACYARTGGTYDPELSTTYKMQEDFATDNFLINEPGLLFCDIFPIISASHEVEASSGIGMGMSSVLINAMMARRDVDSPVWSLDWGWEGPGADKRPGELVIGGMNAARVAKNATALTVPVAEEGCHLSIRVEDHLIGTRKISNATYSGCISPHYPALAVPQRVFDGFNRTLGGVIEDITEGGFHIIPSRYPLDQNFTIMLQANYSITIPFTQLVVRRQVPRPGFALKIIPLKDGVVPLLGQPFLSSAHLVVDRITRTFQLRPSLPKPWGKEKLIPLPPRHLRPPCVPTEEQPQETEAAQLKTKEDEKADEDRKIGIVAGSIGGSFALLAIIAGVAAFLITKRRREKESRIREEEAARFKYTMLGGRAFSDTSSTRTPGELSSIRPTRELESARPTRELDASPPMRELDSTEQSLLTKSSPDMSPTSSYY